MDDVSQVAYESFAPLRPHLHLSFSLGWDGICYLRMQATNEKVSASVDCMQRTIIFLSSSSSSSYKAVNEKVSASLDRTQHTILFISSSSSSYIAVFFN